MIAIQVRPIEPVDLDAATYLGADIDDAWEHNGSQRLLLLVPREDIDADFKIIKHIEHHEIHGAIHYETLYELEVESCFWRAEGRKHTIINDDSVCWEISDHDQ